MTRTLGGLTSQGDSPPLRPGNPVLAPLHAPVLTSTSSHSGREAGP